MENISRLFDLNIRESKVQTSCKKGTIVPVSKDNGKPKSDLRNYRTITLFPVIYKLLEKNARQN